MVERAKDQTAYPGDDASLLCEQIAKDHFIAALVNRGLCS